jgi:hypothetical protein
MPVIGRNDILLLRERGRYHIHEGVVANGGLSVTHAGLVIGVAVYLGIACILYFGWRHLKPKSERYTIFSALSLLGFGFGTASALLAVSSVVYAHAIGGFRYYDPRLLRIYRWGFLLSVTGFLFSVGGVWRPNAWRWYSPLLSLGMLLLWFTYAMGE